MSIPSKLAKNRQSSATAEKEIPETYTLRLPTELRKRVERLANSRNASLNQQIIRILELYFLDSSEMGDSLKSASGRLFEASGEKYDGHGERAIILHFQISEAKTERQIAKINFGVDIQTLNDLRVKKDDGERAVGELGRAIFRFYLRQGIEPESISWSQYAERGYTNTRILHSEEIPTGVVTLEDFLAAINQDDWFDWSFVGNYLQDLNRRIFQARELPAAIELAQELVNLTSSTNHLGGGDVRWIGLEKDLFSALICITARKCGVAKSQIRYMRALVNSPKYLVFEALGRPTLEKLLELNQADEATQSMIFARINQRLLPLAPQPVIPVLRPQKNLGGFNF